MDISLVNAMHVWERNFSVYRRRWMYALLPNFFEPVFYLLGMGLGLGVYVSGRESFPGGYLAFIAPGLVAVSAMNGAAFESTYNIFVKLHFGKLYDAMVATRLTMEDVTAGEMLWAITRSLLYGGIFLLVTLVFGIPVTFGCMLALPAMALIGFCFASIGMTFTSLIDSIDLYPYFYTMFLTPSFLFSGVFFPIEQRFPPALVTVAQCTPLYHAVRLMRGLLQGGSIELMLWSTAYLLILGCILTTIAMSRMRRRVIV